MGVLAILIYLNYTISRYRAQKVVQEVHKMETEKTELELTELELEEFLEEVEKVQAQLRFNRSYLIFYIRSYLLMN